MIKFTNITSALKLKGINLNKAARLTLIAALLIIAFSFFYRLVIFSYQNQNPVTACLLKAKQRYDQQWMTTCLSLYNKQVIQRYGADKLCASMAAEHADPIIGNYHSQLDACLTRYPQ